MSGFFAGFTRNQIITFIRNLRLAKKALEIGKDLNDDVPMGAEPKSIKEEREKQDAKALYNLIYSVDNMSAHAFGLKVLGSTMDHVFGNAPEGEVKRMLNDKELMPTPEFPTPYAYQEFQAVNVRTNVLAEAMQDLNFRYQRLLGKNSLNGFQPLANYRCLADALAANNGLSLTEIDKIQKKVVMPKGPTTITLRAYHLASGPNEIAISRHYDLLVEPGDMKVKSFLLESIIYKDGVTDSVGTDGKKGTPKLPEPRYTKSEIEMLLAGEKQSADFADLSILNVTEDLDKKETTFKTQAVLSGDKYVLDYSVVLKINASSLHSLLKHKAIVDHINQNKKKHASLGVYTNATSCGNYIMSLLEEANVMPRPLVYDARNAPASVLPLDSLEESFLFNCHLIYGKQVKVLDGKNKEVNWENPDSIWHTTKELIGTMDKSGLYIATPTKNSFFHTYCAASAGYLYVNNDQLTDDAHTPQQLSAAAVQALLTREIRNAQQKIQKEEEYITQNLPLEIEDMSKMEDVE